MNIHLMHIDNRHVEFPTWDAIKDAIGSLDGENISSVFLSGDLEFPWLAISGGKNGYVMVQFATGPAKLFSLRNSDKSLGQVSMVLAGQRVTLDLADCVTKDLALKAAQTLWATGSMDTHLEWEPA